MKKYKTRFSPLHFAISKSNLLGTFLLAKVSIC